MTFRAVEDDLETMWQVASHDNQEMRATVRKTLRKLKQHDSLSNKIFEVETDLVGCDSDLEKL